MTGSTPGAEEREVDVRALLGTIPVRITEEHGVLVAHGHADPVALAPFGITAIDRDRAFRLEVADRSLIRAVTARTSTFEPADGSAVGSAPVPSAVDAETGPVSFRTRHAEDDAGAAWEVLGERGDRCLATPSGLDAVEDVLTGSPRGEARDRDLAGLRIIADAHSEWTGDGYTVLPAGPVTAWHGRTLGVAPGWENRSTGSMPPRLRIAPGHTGLLLRSPADLALAFATGAHHLTPTVVEVPTEECGTVTEVRTTATWNGLPVELAQPYLVWRDRGRAVVLGTGKRPDSRDLDTPPVQVLPPSGGRWAVEVGVTDLTDVAVRRS